jgi:hypothetical protein
MAEEFEVGSQNAEGEKMKWDVGMAKDRRPRPEVKNGATGVGYKALGIG